MNFKVAYLVRGLRGVGASLNDSLNIDRTENFQESKVVEQRKLNKRGGKANFKEIALFPIISEI